MNLFTIKNHAYRYSCYPGDSIFYRCCRSSRTLAVGANPAFLCWVTGCFGFAAVGVMLGVPQQLCFLLRLFPLSRTRQLTHHVSQTQPATVMLRKNCEFSMEKNCEFSHIGKNCEFSHIENCEFITLSSKMIFFYSIWHCGYFYIVYVTVAILSYGGFVTWRFCMWRFCNMAVLYVAVLYPHRSGQKYFIENSLKIQS